MGKRGEDVFSLLLFLLSSYPLKKTFLKYCALCNLNKDLRNGANGNIYNSKFFNDEITDVFYII